MKGRGERKTEGEVAFIMCDTILKDYNIPSVHMHCSVIVALLVINPSRVQFPPLAQAHTSTTGEKINEAPLESLATNTSSSRVRAINVQRKRYSPSSTSSKKELLGNPPWTLKVKLSSGSTTVRV